MMFVNQLTEEVQRKQSEYQKCLESYKQMRAKFEENYLKCKLDFFYTTKLMSIHIAFLIVFSGSCNVKGMPTKLYKGDEEDGGG